MGAILRIVRGVEIAKDHTMAVDMHNSFNIKSKNMFIGVVGNINRGDTEWVKGIGGILRNLPYGHRLDNLCSTSDLRGGFHILLSDDSDRILNIWVCGGNSRRLRTYFRGSTVGSMMNRAAKYIAWRKRAKLTYRYGVVPGVFQQLVL
ncbi:hypothetical protein TNCV_3838311 [Trichonephila clavipes]|nr:hypothetical protein TNCV_3838311 [Trichonephila clavipes]